MKDTRNASPAEAMIDALEVVANRYAVTARTNSHLLPSEGHRTAARIDLGIAEALRGVAEEFATALGIER